MKFREITLRSAAVSPPTVVVPPLSRTPVFPLPRGVPVASKPIQLAASVLPVPALNVIALPKPKTARPRTVEAPPASTRPLEPAVPVPFSATSGEPA